MPHKTNSLTALAFAPGVLKTTIPAFVASLIGMLLIPAPALAMQSNSELKDSGFKNIRCIDKTFTKTNEQRSTEWMNFESLENFLVDDNTTIEGLPAPLRAVFIAEKK